MIKVEVVQNKGYTSLYFESRGTSDSDLEELDVLYEILLSNRPKTGGYSGSNRFIVEVKEE